MQVEAQLRIDDPEASVDRNDVKACRTRRPREAIDGAGLRSASRATTQPPGRSNRAIWLRVRTGSV